MIQVQETEPPDAHDRARATIFVWWALFNLLLVVVAVGVTLWVFVTDRALRIEIADLQETRRLACERRVIVAATPPIVDPETEAPPQDRPRNGYFGKSGTAIVPLMRLTLEALRERGGSASQPELLRLGSQEVLPSRTIHIINLWATWCEPCRDEMPDFKALFARRADWGDSVQFVPIQLKDATDPTKAYAELAGMMPPVHVKLADRALKDPLATGLAADEELKLFHEKLPVTLVLDCNRRVRWAQFDQLSAADFKELEVYIDRFRAELEDDSAGAWCTQEWRGNGRCDPGENAIGRHSVEDCGEPKRKPGEAVVAPPPLVEVAPPPVECPEDTIRTPDGKCKRKLRGKPVAPDPEKAQRDTTCGNGVCDSTEDRTTCCLDCPCLAPLTCRTGLGDKPMCLVKGLKM
jgi:hypothetical protein